MVSFTQKPGFSFHSGLDWPSSAFCAIRVCCKRLTSSLRGAVSVWQQRAAAVPAAWPMAMIGAIAQAKTEEDDKVGRLEGIIVDITDRVFLEKSVIQEERLRILDSISA